MEYFILNEHSIKTIKDRSEINKSLVTFFDIYKEAANRDFRQIRVTENIHCNWYEIELIENFTIRNWINGNSNKDYKTRIKSLISATSTPLFKEEDIDLKNKLSCCEFKYENIFVPVLGAAFILNQLSISINSDKIWCLDMFKLNHIELGDEDFTESESIVNNVTLPEHWDIHYKAIVANRNSNKKSKEDRLAIILNYSNIVFTPKALKQALKINDNFFSETLDNLQMIEDKVKDIEEKVEEINYQALIKGLPELDITDESDSVKQNPNFARHRSLFFEEERVFFGHHIRKHKFYNRVHFIIKNKKIVIGYIGKHLPTSKYPK